MKKAWQEFKTWTLVQQSTFILLLLLLLGFGFVHGLVHTGIIKFR